MKKEAKVHMLPTEIKGGQGHTLWTNESGQLLHTKTSSNHLQGQHLYFTTDEKIKEGDWFYNGMNKIVVKATNRYSEMKNPIPHRKIIATTDKLGYCIDEKDGLTGYYLPHIPQHIIEAYVKKPFDKVLVEYEYIYKGIRCLKYDIKEQDEKCEHICSHCFHSRGVAEGVKPKTDSNNCIIIHPVEEKMYSRKEVEVLCRNAHLLGMKETLPGYPKPETIDEWIKENL